MGVKDSTTKGNPIKEISMKNGFFSIKLIDNESITFLS